MLENLQLEMELYTYKAKVDVFKVKALWLCLFCPLSYIGNRSIDSRPSMAHLFIVLRYKASNKWRRYYAIQ